MRASVVNLLVWLKWKVFTRTIVRHTGAVWGIVFASYFFLQISITGFGLLLYSFYFKGTQSAEQALLFALTFIFFFLCLGDFFSLELFESYDIGKLTIFPVSMKQIVVGVVLGATINFSMVVFLPWLPLIVIRFGGSAGTFLPVALTTLLFIFLALLSGLCTSLVTNLLLRKGKAVIFFLIVILSIFSVFYISLKIVDVGFPYVDSGTILDWDALRSLELLPPGIAKNAIVSIAQGSFVQAMFFGLVLVLLTYLLLRLSAFLIGAILTSVEV